MTRSARTVWLVAGALALGVLGAVPTGRTAGPGLDVRVWLVRRIGSAARLVDVSVFVNARDDRSYLAQVAVRVERGRRSVVLEGGATYFYPMSYVPFWPRVYSNATGSPIDGPSCINAAVCGVSAGMIDFPVRSTKPVAFDYYVATANSDTTLQVNKPGWTVKELTGNPDRRGGLQLLRSDGSTSTGVDLPVYRSVERFHGTARAVGGRYGSAVFARIPGCDTFLPPVVTGVGTAQLRGGDTVIPTRNFTCDGDGVAYGSSIKATTWELVGDATGFKTGGTEVLAVFSLPKP